MGLNISYELSYVNSHCSVVFLLGSLSWILCILEVFYIWFAVGKAEQIDYNAYFVDGHNSLVYINWLYLLFNCDCFISHVYKEVNYD